MKTVELKLDKHPLAGQVVQLRSEDPDLSGKLFFVGDWWLNVRPTIGFFRSALLDLRHSVRTLVFKLPEGHNIVYGKLISDETYTLIHDTEIYSTR